MTEAVIPDLLRTRAAESPDAVALVVDGDGSLTYREWDRRSNALARGLAACGVEPGARVAVLFDNARWLDCAVAYVGAHKAGAVAVPLAPRFSPDELAAVLAHCEAAAVVGPADLLAGVDHDGAWRGEVADLEAGQVGDDFQAPLGEGDLAEILYTSGTTGRPKGVACSHANLLWSSERSGRSERPGRSGPRSGGGDGRAGRRVSFLHAFPVGTNAGQELLRLPLRHGDRTAVTLPAFDPDRLCAAVAAHRVGRLQLVPAMAQLVVDAGAPARHDLSTVEAVTLVAAPTPPALLPRLAAAFPTASIWNLYTLTEAGAARTLMVYDPARPASVGRPVGGSEVRVVDDEGADVSPGQKGEVWLRRSGAPRRSYYRDREATEATFAGEWLRTGDLGHLDAEGYLYLVDRKKDLIVTGGANVASVAVEAVLYEHPAVADAAVFGVPHAVLGQDVAAAVVAREPVEARALQAFVRERLAEHEVPHRIVFVESLPRNASGKVLKRELRERYASAPEASRGPRVAPRTATEERLAAIWAEVLGVEVGELGVDDDFFERGGHSLAATAVLARVHDAFGVTLPVGALFDAPTLAELARLVSVAAVAEAPQPAATGG